MSYKLTEEIIRRSVANNWQYAKLEWSFDSIYKSSSPKTCLCGKFPIINICIIRNSKNNSSTEVGNCCVNKFLGIKEGNKFFDSYSRIKEDYLRSISLDIIDYLYEKSIYTEWEYKFYLDIHKKRNLSAPQQKVKRRLNQKFLAAIKEKSNKQRSKLEKAIGIEGNTSFLISILNQLNKKGELSEKQEMTLDDIINWKKATI